MQNTKLSVSRNGYQGGASQARLQPISSRQGVGNTRSHTSNLGAGAKQSPRPRSENPPHYSQRSHGGQAAGAGLFGLRLTGGTGSAPKAAAVREVQQARPVGDDQPGRVGGLSFGQRRAIVCRPSPAEIERRNAAMRAAAIASDLRQEREWHEYAELVEAHPTLPYGSVETACALND